MDVTVSLSVLREAAKKHPAFWQDITAVGSVEGDKIRLNEQEFQLACTKHFGSLAVGNIVHTLVKPIAKVLHKENCGNCADRQVKMNTIVQ